MDSEELAAWLRLTESVSPDAARRLLAMAGSPQAVFQLPQVALQQVLPQREREALARPPQRLASLVERSRLWLDGDTTHDVMLLGDADYPPALLATADPPLMLWLSGCRSRLNDPALAIAGSRHPTREGMGNARAFASALAHTGLTIVSGLALGVDAAAHEGALAAGQGATVAVLGTGLDQIYPRQNTGLAKRIVEVGGLVVSEYPLSTPLNPTNFPRRNRIIAGLSQGCLVIEAALKSGSMITARLAAEAGREVFAIPGSIHSPLSRGCHSLIRQGAKLVESAQDVLEELRPARPPEAADEEPPLPHRLSALAGAMGVDPVSREVLQARSGWPMEELDAALLQLELRDEIVRLTGQLFQRRRKG